MAAPSLGFELSKTPVRLEMSVEQSLCLKDRALHMTHWAVQTSLRFS